MYDQSYNANTLASTLRKGDFRGIASHLQDAFRKDLVATATISALGAFKHANPISAFHLKKKSAYRIQNLHDDLVVRKLSKNLLRLTRIRTRGRSFVISNLRLFLEEGLPYRVYRLDIKKFYESFDIEHIKDKTLALRTLTPLSKRHLIALLDHYKSIGGQGLPRGMAISAVLSEWLMSDFDAKLRATSLVYFYGRYVDDIIIITNASELETDFLAEIALWLPPGLKLSEKKKSVHTLPGETKPVKPPEIEPREQFSFDYLGYSFIIYEPVRNEKGNPKKFRLVRIEIAQEKIKKIKRRIVRSFVEFNKTGDSVLLIERIRFLTSNFSITDKNTGKRQLSGIFHSYPLLSEKSKSLAELDAFLRNAVLSKRGRVFGLSGPSLPNDKKRILLALRFTHGHKTRHFINFSPAKIGEIQECWKYE